MKEEAAPWKSKTRRRSIFVRSADEIIEKAFSALAKSKGSGGGQKGATFAKNDATAKIKAFSSCLRKELSVMERKFPDFERMSPFHKDTIKSAFDLGKVRRAIAALKGAAGVIGTLERKTLRKIWGSHSASTVGKLKKEFLGRAVSFVKRNRANIKLLKETAIFLDTLPDVREEFTAIIAGFPNVGKSTLLYRITGSMPRIENYPFTTQNIMMGYAKTGNEEVQFIDTPGILDKRPEKRNPVEKRAVAAMKNLADVMLFVADASERCGFPLKEQKKLLGDIKKEFAKSEFIVVLNKADMASGKQIEEGQKLFPDSLLGSPEKEAETRGLIMEEMRRLKPAKVGCKGHAGEERSRA
jgi:nucleolar GTP-binding protein